MIPKKTLILDVSDFRNIQVYKEGSEVDIKDPVQFVVYEPRMYSIKTPDDILVFLTAVLQNNHKWSYEPGTKELIVDDMLLKIDGSQIVSPNLKFSFWAPNDEKPRNNLKIYQEFLPFLRGEKRILNLLDKIKIGLQENDIFKEHFREIEQNFFHGIKNEIHVMCSSYNFDNDGLKGERYPNFVVAFNTDTKELSLKHFLHNEGEIYNNGDEPLSLSDMEFDLLFIQNKINRFKQLEQKISSIKINQ